MQEFSTEFKRRRRAWRVSVRILEINIGAANKGCHARVYESSLVEFSRKIPGGMNLQFL